VNKFLRTVIISCACFCTAQATTQAIVLQKEVLLKTDTKIKIRAFALVNKGQLPTQDTCWYSVFPIEGQLAFYCEQGGEKVLFPVTHVIQITDPTIIEFDLSDKELKSAIVEPGKKVSSLLTMKISFSPEIQIFKELVILLGKADKSNLEAYINNHSAEIIEEILCNAIINQGDFAIIADDKEACENIREGKLKISKPTQLTGKYVFIPAQEVLAALMAAEEAQQNNEHKA
jgi:hypothetical protein